jgi:predicted O-methyltransferase YrrM
MKNRGELAKYFNELGFKTGVEVGVCDGTYSLVLEQSIPGVKLYGVDPYITYQRYADYRRQGSLERAYGHAKEKLALYPTYEFIIKTSMIAVKQFADESLDFVFIDGNHTYDFVKEDINAWTPKVRKGGIVSGHDFYVFPSGDHGVIFAVLEYVSAHRITLKTTDWDLENLNRDERQPSWYFTKR